MTINEHNVQNIFDSIAKYYDQMNTILSFNQHKRWRKFAMQQLGMMKGKSAIDLCCGTCDWTISLAKASETGEIVGIDFSEQMLAYGRQKIEGTSISLVHGNVMNLPFPNERFDYATIGFGLRNVPDIQQVLKEMNRVLKPGGKAFCLELSKPQMQPFKGLYYAYFEYGLPLVAKVVAKKYEQYKWLPESLKLFPNRKELESEFLEAGFHHVKSFSLTGGIAALHIGEKK